MSFDQLIELFAKSYKPLSHSEEEKHKSFYRIGRFGDDNEFTRNFNTAISPCVQVSCAVDAHTVNNGHSYETEHMVYFLIKQKASLAKTQRQDDNLAASMTAELNDMVIDLLAWLRAYKLQHPSSDAIKGVNIQDVEWSTLPPSIHHLNGWIVMLAIFPHVIPISTCLNSSKFYT